MVSSSLTRCNRRISIQMIWGIVAKNFYFRIQIIVICIKIVWSSSPLVQLHLIVNFWHISTIKGQALQFKPQQSRYIQ